MAFLSDFLFTLHTQSDALTYTLTTNQCGARLGSPQLKFAELILFKHCQLIVLRVFYQNCYYREGS